MLGPEVQAPDLAVSSPSVHPAYHCSDDITVKEELLPGTAIFKLFHVPVAWTNYRLHWVGLGILWDPDPHYEGTVS